MNSKFQNGTTALDKVDCGMINLLQKDGRMPIVSLATQLNISETTARSRLKRLLDSRIIDIVAVSNPIELGFEIISGSQRSVSRVRGHEWAVWRLRTHLEEKKTTSQASGEFQEGPTSQ